jgi:hypothetical protein
MVRAVLVAPALVAAAGLAPAPAHAQDARLSGTFALAGRITVAQHIRGEHRGQRVARRWTFRSSCPQGPCPLIGLVRQRAGGKADRLTLHHVGEGLYLGSGRFTVALRCHGRVYRRGGLVPFEVSVRVLASEPVGDEDFATAVRARYHDRGRRNRTPCPGGIGHDAAVYGGLLRSPLPTPPTAAFTVTRSGPQSTTIALRDASTGGARIVSEQWDFGDPAAGAADHATGAAPIHVYPGHGTFAVTLTVRDANGLTATVRRALTL